MKKQITFEEVKAAVVEALKKQHDKDMLEIVKSKTYDKLSNCVGFCEVDYKPKIAKLLEKFESQLEGDNC